jgi:pyocin large subunit-like protein
MFGRAKRCGATALFLLALFVLACGSPQAPSAEVPKAKPAGEPAAAPPHIQRPDVGFASQQKLVEHYRKHGREFGAITLEQYLGKAQELRDRPAGGPILESVRPDGVITRFDRTSGDFIAFNRNGVIRTYFRPADGEAYYQRQLKRKH